jgi:hypothetical protein
VTSAGGAATRVAGSNSGVQPGSASVAGFPSLAASRIAVIGRHVFQRYLLSQQPIAASAVRNVRFHSAHACSCPR